MRICTYLPVNVEVGVPVKWLKMPEVEQVKGEGDLGFCTVYHCTGRVHVSGNVCFSVKQIFGELCALQEQDRGVSGRELGVCSLTRDCIVCPHLCVFGNAFSAHILL